MRKVPLPVALMQPALARVAMLRVTMLRVTMLQVAPMVWSTLLSQPMPHYLHPPPRSSQQAMLEESESEPVLAVVPAPAAVSAYLRCLPVTPATAYSARPPQPAAPVQAATAPSATQQY